MKRIKAMETRNYKLIYGAHANILIYKDKNKFNITVHALPNTQRELILDDIYDNLHQVIGNTFERAALAYWLNSYLDKRFKLRVKRFFKRFYLVTRKAFIIEFKPITKGI